MKLKGLLGKPLDLLRKCGYDIVRYVEKNNAADNRRLQVIQNNRIDIVLDIGAAEGTFVKKIRESGYKGKIISFEPLKEAYGKLVEVSKSDSLLETINSAIGNTDGETIMNVSRRKTSSSILPMHVNHILASPDSQYIRTERVKIKPLDSFLNGLIKYNNRLYIKIDVQGYENNVLAGAMNTLQITKAIEIELSMVPLYEGSILYSEMINKLDKAGFCIVSWEDVFINPETGYVLQSDCIFVRDLQ